MTLRDRSILITGATRGLGRALALGFAREGASLTLSARSAGDLDKAAAEARAAGGKVAVAAGSVADPAHAEELVSAALAAHGRLDVVINNASILGPRVPLAEYPEATFREALLVNTYGPFILVRAALPELRRARGTVINVTSGVGTSGKAGWGAYSVAKFGLEGLGQILAEEEAATGIRVYTVDPGGMRTGMRAEAYPDEDPATLPAPEANFPLFSYLAGDPAEPSGTRIRAREWLAARV